MLAAKPHVLVISVSLGSPGHLAEGPTQLSVSLAPLFLSLCPPHPAACSPDLSSGNQRALFWLRFYIQTNILTHTSSHGRDELAHRLSRGTLRTASKCAPYTAVFDTLLRSSKEPGICTGRIGKSRYADIPKCSSDDDYKSSRNVGHEI